MTTEKGSIELQLGAIAPVARGLWYAAWEKLNEAAAGVKHMEEAKDRIEYEAGWTRLVDSLEEFWTRFFDEGKNKFSSFQPWAGAIEVKKTTDPLLRYLYQARHQSQHGRIALEWESGRVQIGGEEFFGTVKDLRNFADGAFEADVNPTVGSDAKFKVIHNPGKARLPVVENRKFKQSYNPPHIHLDKPIADTSPINIGRLGVAYYDNLLRQAFAKFAKAP